jgi:hypothetical protein
VCLLLLCLFLRDNPGDEEGLGLGESERAVGEGGAGGAGGEGTGGGEREDEEVLAGDGRAGRDKRLGSLRERWCLCSLLAVEGGGAESEEAERGEREEEGSLLGWGGSGFLGLGDREGEEEREEEGEPAERANDLKFRGGVSLLLGRSCKYSASFTSETRSDIFRCKASRSFASALTDICRKVASISSADIPPDELNSRWLASRSGRESFRPCS